MVATSAAAAPSHPSSLNALSRRVRVDLRPDAVIGSGLQSTWIWVILLLGASVLVLLVVQATPPVATVYRVWPSGACRAVVTSDGARVGCGDLPRLHHVVWVSPNWDGVVG